MSVLLVARCPGGLLEYFSCAYDCQNEHAMLTLQLLNVLDVSDVYNYFLVVNVRKSQTTVRDSYAAVIPDLVPSN